MCWAALAAILSHMRSVGRRLDAPAEDGRKTAAHFQLVLEGLLSSPLEESKEREQQMGEAKL